MATMVDACIVCHREEVVAPSTAAFEGCGKCKSWMHHNVTPNFTSYNAIRLYILLLLLMSGVGL